MDSFDVLIVENKTRKVDAVIGKSLSERKAEQREMTGISRINSNYHVRTEIAGLYKEGDIIK